MPSLVEDNDSERDLNSPSFDRSPNSIMGINPWSESGRIIKNMTRDNCIKPMEWKRRDTKAVMQSPKKKMKPVSFAPTPSQTIVPIAPAPVDSPLLLPSDVQSLEPPRMLDPWEKDEEPEQEEEIEDDIEAFDNDEVVESWEELA